MITTPFSFIASANCLLFERRRTCLRRYRPGHVQYRSRLRSPAYLETECRKEKATGLAGGARDRAEESAQYCLCTYSATPATWTAIREIAAEYRLAIIEDACEAIGAEFRGAKAGSFGDAAVFAFYPNKQMTTGEGGMLVTDDEKVADLCRQFRNQGRGERQRVARTRHDRVQLPAERHKLCPGARTAW